MRFRPDNTKIAVIGGGNIGTQFACVLASKGYSVNLHSSKPWKFDGILEAEDECGNITVGKLNCWTSDMEQAVEGCDIVMVTHPASSLKNVADKLLPYVREGINILVLPGTGGAEFSFSECMLKGALLYGLQRVPSVARLQQYGKKVRCEGLRNELHLGGFSVEGEKDMAEFMEYVWGIPCHILPNYLCVTLTPSNPILHTTRLRTLFSDYVEGKVYDRNPLFYGEWTDEASKLLIACDEELQNMLKYIDRLDLSSVHSLKLHYESDTAEALTRKLRSIKSLNKLSSPMKQVEGGWIPDFETRFFTSDFAYGLVIIEELGYILGADIPNIRETMNWYRSVTGDLRRMDIASYGLNSPEDIYSYYERLEQTSR